MSAVKWGGGCLYHSVSRTPKPPGRSSYLHWWGTNAAGDITGSGSHSFLFREGGAACFLVGDCGERSMSQCCSCELMIWFFIFFFCQDDPCLWSDTASVIDCFLPAMLQQRYWCWHCDSHPIRRVFPKIFKASCQTIWAFFLINSLGDKVPLVLLLQILGSATDRPIVGCCH